MQTVVVASGTSGVGNTMLVSNSAVALAENNRYGWLQFARALGFGHASQRVGFVVGGKLSLKQYLLHGLKWLNCDYVLLDRNAGRDTQWIFYSPAADYGAGHNTAIFCSGLPATKKQRTAHYSCQFCQRYGGLPLFKAAQTTRPFIVKIYLAKIFEQIHELESQSYEIMGQGMQLWKPKMVVNMLRCPKDMQLCSALTNCVILVASI